MNGARQHLLKSLRKSLTDCIGGLKGTGSLEEAVSGWILGETAASLLSLEAAAQNSATLTGASRTYQHVAILGYVADLVEVDPGITGALVSGLDWLSGRAAFSQVPTSFEVDGKALLGVALGARRCKHQTAIDWMAGFLKQSGSSRLAPWERALISGASCVIGVPDLIKTPPMDELADVRVALRSRGVDIGCTPVDEQRAVDAVLRHAPEVDASWRTAAHLRVLDWVIQEACAVDMSSPTPEQVLQILQRVSASMRRWRWDEAKPQSGLPVQWQIENEYHVQDLLWTILAPLFPDLEDEENLPSLGQKHPRCDLGIRSLHLIIEVKFIRNGTKREFSEMIGQIAEDHTLYLRQGSNYDKMIVFAWDNSCTTEQHDEFKQAFANMQGVVGCAVIGRPKKMKRN